jgi:very-short-patch-repair endonuclease
MNFGPLNKDGGWRRLNVAITRSRREMLVFTSFDPSLIDLNRTNARAVRDLKHFIEFAQRGPKALAEAVQGSVGSYDSPFEEAVANGLRGLGWQVVPQIGVSRFRIDLGIVHPDRPGDYLAGVECDGATYHSAATARDRDKVRGAILQGLGWQLLRLWSTDWWVDRAGALQRLHEGLNELLEQSRAAQLAVAETPVEAPVQAVEPIVEPTPSPGPGLPAAPRDEYRAADLGALAASLDAEQFHQPAYTPVLRQLIGEVLRQEAPILDTLLVQRIARAHGFGRSGRLIRDRVLELAEQHYHVQQTGLEQAFVWQAEADVEAWARFRVPASASDLRGIEEIAAEELRMAARTVTAGDLPAEVARLFGIKRLNGAGRERIERVFMTL